MLQRTYAVAFVGVLSIKHTHQIMSSVMIGRRLYENMGRKGEDFSYSGSVAQGTEIAYGINKNKIKVTAAQYRDLILHFKGKTVEIGTSHDNPPRDSVGEWLQANVTKTQISSYVGPILIFEHFATQVGKSQIRFK